MVVFIAGEGGSVSSPGGEYDEGTVISVTANPAAEYEFERWSDGSTQNPRSITVTQATVLTASFVKKQYEFTVNVQGEGTVKQDVLIQGSKLNSGSQVKLTALPATGWYFDSWTGSATGNANPLSVDINSSKTITAVFKRKKFDLTVSVEGEGTVTEQVVVQPGQYDFETQVKLTATPAEGWEFVNWTGDIDSSDNPITITVNTAKNITANFNKLELVSMEILNPIDTLVISRKHKFQVEGTYSNGSKVDLSELVEITSQNENITILEKNEITGAKGGIETAVIRYSDSTINLDLLIQDYEILEPPINLRGDGQCELSVPVILINYFPTNDGVIQDERRGPTDWNVYYEPTLEHMKEVIMQNVLVTKNSIEEGTRFRDFGGNTKPKYVCIDIIKVINLYSLPLKRWGVPDSRVNTIDYKILFPKLNIEDYVNNAGVKEIWLGAFQNFGATVIQQDESIDRDFFWGIPESNMSSPLTGDISNSWRIQNDLPIYNKSYIVYALIGDSGADSNLHMRGHQIEVMMNYLDKSPASHRLFENQFVGRKNNSYAYNGRVGNTHFPPNASTDYDYYSSYMISSDILSWKPDGGDTTSFNRDTYFNINYENIDFVVPTARSFKFGDFGDRDLSKSELMWHILWNQSIPGYQNNIPFVKDGVEYTLTNWWDLIYNWDEAIQQGKTLWE